MSYLHEMQRTGTINTNTPMQMQATASKQGTIEELKDIIQNQKEYFERLIQVNKNRTLSLEKEVSQLRKELDTAKSTLEKINDKEVVARTREELFGRREKPPSEKPIDRNGVAPKDVEIGKIFNFSSKRF